ncbi:AraC-like DNA-binding protein [Parabacteroides sp. PFB2-10]|uniref:helix-turn-helix domain-containing protein n=1 Tax=Parabacteroides sp. PFB2-10 TaxID=1742405 RepID=UPI0024738ECF|nr:helix-turn-helix domain-containing protein [Parabacteroides sp. PFB2-10]MDH6314241.1 AraC-like DNA-binding protein [Parabacteroides sp. PFB2-10]MDL2244268.1 helix-turn-helix domain-containing protein [Parabacteroides sp. OttesenSCG-928-J18]
MKRQGVRISKSCKTALIIIPFLFSLHLFAAQTPIEKRDSLRRLIPSLEGDEKLNAWHDMSNIYFAGTSTPAQLDTLLAIYDEFEAETIQQKNIDQQALVKGNRVMAFSNMRMYDEVIKRAPACLEFLQAHQLWKYYFPVCQIYIKAKIATKQFDEALEIAGSLKKQAEETDQQEGLGTALQAMANIYTTMRRNEEALDYYQQAVEIVDKIEPVSSNLPLLHFDFCKCLLTLHRYEELEEAIKGFEKANQRWEERTGMKEYPSKINLLQIYTRFYLATGQYDKAETYCNTIDSIGSVKVSQMTIASYRMQIYEARKEYDKALLLLDKELELSSQERNINFSALLIRKARILSHLGEAEESFRLAEESFLLRDSLRSLDLNKQLDEVRTQYEVERLTLETQRNRNYFLFALIGCVLLAIALIIWIIYSRRLKAKNRALYEQIQTRKHNDRQLEQQTLSRPVEMLSREQQLFHKLSHAMKEKMYFKESDLDRRILAEYLATNERYLADAIRQATGDTFTQYINQLRLTFSLDLLADPQYSSIQDIAIEAGFASYHTYLRLFTKTYGMKPSEYRQMAK